MSKIIGNTTATPTPRSDWNQTNETKADFILNKPVLGALSEKDTVDKNDLSDDVQASLEKVDTIDSKISTHNTSTSAHDDIRQIINQKADLTHASQHATNGSDPLTPEMIGIEHMLYVGTEEPTEAKVGDVWIDTDDDGESGGEASSGVTMSEVNAAINAAIGRIPTYDVDGQIRTHNTATDAHSDIRNILSSVKEDVDTFFNNADLTESAKDTLKEIQDYIDSDVEAAAAMTASINNKADKDDINALQQALDGHLHTVSDITDLTATVEELNYVDGVTSSIQDQLDGKAPAGYGLGSTVSQYVDDLNKAVKSGWYYGTGNTINGAASGSMIIHVNARTGEDIEQEVFMVSSRCKFIRSTLDGGETWIAEWVNPSMQPGVEYRTTERIDGKSVYKKNDGGVIQYRLDGETGWKPYAHAVGAATSNPNLFDNWYFADPIDQRGGMICLQGTVVYSDPECTVRIGPTTNTSDRLQIVSTGNYKLQGIEFSAYAKAEDAIRGYADPTSNLFYTIDRWRMSNANRSNYLNIVDGGIRVHSSSNGFSQPIDPSLANELNGKTLTVTIKYINGGIKSTTFVYDSSITSKNVGSNWYIGHYASTGNHYILYTTGSAPEDWEAIKLEIGSVQTLAYQDADGNWVLNDPPPNNKMELLKCCMSTADSADTYANKVVYHTGNKPTAADVGAPTVAEMNTAINSATSSKQNKITGTAGQFVVIGEDGNVTTKTIAIAEEASF